jgi:hypothetical protein
VSPAPGSRLLVAAVAGGALALTAALPAAANAPRPVRCPAMSVNIGNIVVEGLGCDSAYRVIEASIAGHRVGGFVCRSTLHPGGASVRCHQGRRRIRFQIAD